MIIYSRNDNLGIIITSILIVGMLLLFMYVVFVRPLRDSIPYKNWSWFAKIIFQIVPGIFLLVIIVYFTIVDVRAIQYMHQWNQGKYQMVEGKLNNLTVEEIWVSGSQEPSYECSFSVGDIYFPSSNYYSCEQMRLLSEEPFVKIYYLYDNGNPWPWKIEKIKEIENHEISLLE